MHQDMLLMKKTQGIVIDAKRFSVKLLYVCVTLFLLNLTAIYIAEVLEIDSFFSRALLYYFDASRESNIPTLFSTLILVLACLLTYISYINTPRAANTRIFWKSLCLIFAFLTIDEAATIHEQFNKLRPVIGDESGYLYYAWIVPYAVVALAVGIYFIRFLTTLPARTRNLFVASGIIFVSSALGFEVLEGRVSTIYGQGNVYDKLLCAAEEFLEMSAIVLFIYALLDFLSDSHPKMVVIGKKEQI